VTILIGGVMRLAGPCLFAARNLGAAGRRSRVSSGETMLYVGMAAVAIAAVCLILYVVTRWVQKRRHFSHAALFTGLCQAHGLDRRARGTLKKVAACRRVTPAARVFIEPKWLDPSNLGGSLRSQASKIAALRDRLFGETAG